MAAAFGVQHYAEYFTFIERLKTVAGRKDFLGNEFLNKGMQDIGGNADRTGHRIRVTMKDNSFGPAGRQGIMTFDYDKGLTLQHHVGVTARTLGFAAKLLGWTTEIRSTLLALANQQGIFARYTKPIFLRWEVAASRLAVHAPKPRRLVKQRSLHFLRALDTLDHRAEATIRIRSLAPIANNVADHSVFLGNLSHHHLLSKCIAFL